MAILSLNSRNNFGKILRYILGNQPKASVTRCVSFTMVGGDLKSFYIRKNRLIRQNIFFKADIRCIIPTPIVLVNKGRHN